MLDQAKKTVRDAEGALWDAEKSDAVTRENENLFVSRSQMPRIIWWFGFVAIFVCSINLPGCLIPTKWSDFEFWSQQLALIRQNRMKQWQAEPIVYWERGVRHQLTRMVVLVCACIILLFFHKNRKIKRKR